MPIYEYQCRDCDHEFEAIRKISAEPLTECPACGQHSVQKLVSKAAFRLKGTGWYETDFKDKPNKNESGSGEKTSADGAEKKSSDSGEKKTDSKTDSKSEKKKTTAAKAED